MVRSAGRTKASPQAGIRILVENGEYPLLNRGDVAMLSVEVGRLRRRWPSARIGVLTDRPALLRSLVPEAEPIVAHRGGNWPKYYRTARLSRLAASGIVRSLSTRGHSAIEIPRRRLHLTGAPSRGRQRTPEGIPGGAVPCAASDATLIVAGGGGYMTDADKYQAHRTLNLLEHAHSLGIPTVMVGQGIGPVTDRQLLERAAKVLPAVDIIGLREGRRGTELLERLGVARDRILVTGDDAVEFGYLLRRGETGSDIGVCLRIAAYSQVDAAARQTIGTVVRNVATELNAGLLPLIVSEHGGEDRRSTLPLIDGFARRRPPIGQFGTARQLAAQVAQCRLLVTSTYHLAVFALSQGIPVVAITSSAYYDDKFYGLAAMFGAGLIVVHVGDTMLAETLTRHIQELWTSAPALRGALHKRAAEQIAASEAAFDRVFELVSERCSAT